MSPRFTPPGPDYKPSDEEVLIYGHVMMPLDAEGRGPEMDPELVVDTICWVCLVPWPCEAAKEQP